MYVDIFVTYMYAYSVCEYQVEIKSIHVCVSYNTYMYVYVTIYTR